MPNHNDAPPAAPFILVMLGLVMLVAVPVWLACYTIASKLPALRAARAMVGQ